MVGAHLKIYLFGSRLDRDHSYVGPSIEDEPNHLGTTHVAPSLEIRLGTTHVAPSLLSADVGPLS